MSSEGNIGLGHVCPTGFELVVRFLGKQAGMPIWRTDLEVYAPLQAVRVIRGLECCFVFAVTDSAQLTTRFAHLANLMLDSQERTSASEKETRAGPSRRNASTLSR